MLIISEFQITNRSNILKGRISMDFSLLTVVSVDADSEALPARTAWNTIRVQNVIRGRDGNGISKQKFCHYENDRSNTLWHTAQAVCRGLDLGDAYSVYAGNTITGDAAQLKCDKDFLNSVDYNHCRIEPRPGSCAEMKIECLKNSCFEPDNVVFVPALPRYGQRCKGCSNCFETNAKKCSTVAGNVSWDPHFTTTFEDDYHADFL